MCYSKIFKILSYILFGFLLILILIEVLFYLNEDRIQRELMAWVHQLQRGEISVQDIGLSPFHQFPNISIKLEDALYYERRAEERDDAEQPICDIGEVFLTFDIISLFQGKINFSNITLNDGVIRIIQHADSTVNLFNALSSPSQQPKEDTARSKINLKLENIALSNLEVNITNKVIDRASSVYIKGLNSSLSFIDHYMDCEVGSDMIIRALFYEHNNPLNNRNLQILLNFRFDFQTLYGDISSGELTIEGARFGIAGTFDLSNEGYVDLGVEGIVKDFVILSPFIQEAALKRNIKNFEKGNIYFEGTIRGKTVNQVPFAEFSFGAKNLHFDIGQGIDPIEEFGFSGYFSTGHKDDFSDAEFKLENVRGKVPGGYVDGNIEIRNFQDPDLLLKWDSEIDISHLDEVFKPGYLKDLRGIIRIKADIDGKLDFTKQKVLNKGGTLSIFIDNVAFNSPKVKLSVDSLNGSIEVFENLVYLQNITATAGKSDLKVDGEVRNLVQRLFGRRTDTRAQLTVQLKRSMSPELILPDSQSGGKFDEEIDSLNADLTLTVNPPRSTKNFPLPGGTLQLHQFSASLKNYSNIHHLTGKIRIQKDTIRLEGLEGKIGSSDLKLSANLFNYPALMDTGTVSHIGLEFNISSHFLRLPDILKYNGKMLLPLMRENHIHENFYFAGETRITNRELFSGKPLPEFELQVRELRWQLPANPEISRDFRLQLLCQKDDLLINDFQGRLGDSDFLINARIKNILPPEKETNQGLQILAEVKAERLKIDDFLPLFGSGEKRSGPRSLQLPRFQVNLTAGALEYQDLMVETISGEITSDGLAKTPVEDSIFYATLFRNLNGTLKAGILQTNRFKIMNLKVSLDGKGGILQLSPSGGGFWGVNGTGYASVNFSGTIPKYRIQYRIDNFAIEKLISRFSDNKIMTGNMNFSIDLAMQGRNFSDIRETLNGEVILQGKNLTVYGLDIDELLSKFERSQRFNLVDMGAFFLAGPAGAAVTKTFDYAGVIISAQNPGERSNIPNLISFWEINNGVANANDVALITNRSRIALKGALNFNSNEYKNLTIAVVDKKGCTLLSQLMNGSFNNPEIEQITAVEAILAPVVNVLRFITLQDCRPFYSGSLKHPE